MLKSEKQTLWRLSSGLMGASLPLMLFGSGIMGAVLVLGILLALLATKGNSLRDTVMFLLRSPVVWSCTALLVTFFVSAVFSVDITRSMDKVLDLAVMMGLALGLALALREMPGRYMELMYQSLALGTTAVALLVIIDASVADAQLSSALYGNNSLAPDRAHFMSAVLAVLSPFLWSWLLRRHKEGIILAKWLAMPVVVFSVTAVFMAGGFAGWAAMLVALVLFLYYATAYHRLRWDWRYVVPSAILLVLGPLFYVLGQNHLDGPNATPVVLLDRVSDYMTARVTLWQEALVYFKQNPLIGTGVHTFRLLPLAEGNAHPHNFVVQLLLETGVFGTVIVLAIMAMMLRYFVRAAATNLYGVAGLGAISAFFVSALAQTSIFDSWWLTFLIFSGIFAARTGFVIERKLR